MSEKVEVEARGQNVEAAIEAGVAKLGLSRNDVIVEIIDEGSRGLLGIGARDAVVRITGVRPSSPPVMPTSVSARTQPKSTKQQAVPAIKKGPAVENGSRVQSKTEDTAAVVETSEPDPQEAEIALELLQIMLEKMHVKANVNLSLSEPDDLTGRRVNILDIQGEDLTVLIGTRGETLNALQYITRLMVGHRLRQRSTFVIDVQGYRQRRELALSRLAERMAKKALQRQRPISLEPMPPYERRIIHMTLRDHQGVYTESTGEGNRRKVRILPK